MQVWRNANNADHIALLNRTRLHHLTRIRRKFVFKGEHFFAYHDKGRCFSSALRYVEDHSPCDNSGAATPGCEPFLRIEVDFMGSFYGSPQVTAREKRSASWQAVRTCPPRRQQIFPDPSGRTIAAFPRKFPQSGWSCFDPDRRWAVKAPGRMPGARSETPVLRQRPPGGRRPAGVTAAGYRRSRAGFSRSWRNALR